MARKITFEQYANNVNAMANWPNRLISGPHYRDTPDSTEACTVGYLALRAGVGVGNGILGYDKISQAYGIHIRTLIWWAVVNDVLYLFSGQRRRARRMKRIFEKSLNRATVLAPALPEGSALQDELYETPELVLKR